MESRNGIKNLNYENRIANENDVNCGITNLKDMIISVVIAI